MLYKICIKYFILIMICIVFSAIPAQTKSMYVTDVLKVTLRTGPSIENKILKMIESGQKVELMVPGQEWSHVKLLDAKEGWTLTVYLISNKTNQFKLEELEALR